MAIAFDAQSSQSNTGSSITISHTTSGSDRLLVVYIFGATGGYSVSAITYNGVAMTSLGSNTTDARFKCYYLIAPASGTNNISITLSASMVYVVAAVSYTGVKQTGFPDNSSLAGTTASGTSSSKSLTPVANNCWMIAGCHIQANSGSTSGQPTAGASTTRRVQINNVTNVYGIAALDNNAPINPAASTTLNGSSTNDNSWYWISMTIEPAPAPTPQNNPAFLLNMI